MATYYATNVNGAGTWSSTNMWSTSSGGASGSGPPTASDDVIFDSNSPSATITATAACRSLDCTAGTGSYANTLTHNNNIVFSIGTSTANGSGVALKLVAGMTYTTSSNSQLNFVSTSATQLSITTGGLSLGAHLHVYRCWRIVDSRGLV